MTVSFDNPPHLAARGTVVVLPGRGEDANVYERLGLRLSFDAYRVRVLDDPTRDPAAATATVKSLLADDLPAPHVLLGSDTGALFAALLVAERTVTVDGLVLAGLPTTPQTGEAPDWETELNARTTCPTHRTRLTTDTDFQRGALWTAPPPDWPDRANPAAVPVPVAGLHGADDQLSTLDEVRAWFTRLPHGELVSLAGTAHDALNNQTHRTAAAVIVRFLESLRFGAAGRPGRGAVTRYVVIGAGAVGPPRRRSCTWPGGRSCWRHGARTSPPCGRPACGTSARTAPLPDRRRPPDHTPHVQASTLRSNEAVSGGSVATRRS